MYNVHCLYEQTDICQTYKQTYGQTYRQTHGQKYEKIPSGAEPTLAQNPGYVAKMEGSVQQRGGKTGQQLNVKYI